MLLIVTKMFIESNALYNKCNIVGASDYIIHYLNKSIYFKGEKEIMKNKGFSLVELIIVIAIMAILAAAIAPALIRYIDKSRRSDDVAAAETLNTAMQAALSNEAIYDECQSAMSLSKPEDTVALVSADADTAFSSTAYTKLAAELNSSAGGKTPKLKFTKDGAKGWIVGANGAGKPVVWLYNNGSWSGHTAQNNDTSATVGGETAIMLQPSIDNAYK